MVFYNFLIPEWLGTYYALPGVLASQVGAVGFDDDEYIYPCLAVLPMGCSWAVHWCHEAHTRILRNAGCLKTSTLLQDFTPPVKMSPGPPPRRADHCLS